MTGFYMKRNAKLKWVKARPRKIYQKSISLRILAKGFMYITINFLFCFTAFQERHLPTSTDDLNYVTELYLHLLYLHTETGQNNCKNNLI